MATFNKYQSNMAINVDGIKRKGMAVLRIDTKTTPIAAGDDWRVWYIPPKTVVTGVDLISVQPQGTANTVHIGDSGNAQHFGANVSANLAAGVAATANNYAMRKYYNNADYIRVTAVTALNNAIFDLVVHWEMLDGMTFDTVT